METGKVGVRHLMRLPGFDYTRPLYYMVTLKRLAEGTAFSAIAPNGELIANEVTRAFRGVFAAFSAKWRCVKSLVPYVIMPDHIHLLVKLKAVEKPKSLAVIVYQLRAELTRAYWASVAPRWHLPRQKEPFCAKGRMLYLSLYEATTREPTNAELYARCHEMVDLACEKLTVKL